jgi:hypothetical protein
VSVLPIWLPTNHVRFNYADFGLEQAVGAIKARVQENGGQHLPLTAMRAAEIFRLDEQFRRDKSRMNSEEGIGKIFNSVAELFRQIEKCCADIKGQHLLQIRCGTDLNEGSAIQTCIVTDGHVSFSVVWYQQYSNLLDNSSLTIREYKGGLTLPRETGQRMYVTQPSQLCENKYSPDLSLSRDYGWRQIDATKAEFLSSLALADQCVIRFVDLVNRFARGEIKNRISK